MEKRRPKLGLFVSDPRIRLSVVQDLSAAYRIEIVSPAQGPVKAFRKHRPVAVLLCANPRELGRMGEKARALKTEQRPPIVGLIALAGLPPDPERYLQAHLLDSLTSLPESPEVLLGWVEDLLAGRGSVVGKPAPGNRLRHVFRRISGFRASSADE
jgi:hypothetical protein